MSASNKNMNYQKNQCDMSEKNNLTKKIIRNRIVAGMLVCLLAIMTFVSIGMTAVAARPDVDPDDYEYYYKNKQTGYVAYIDDQAGLLSNNEAKQLLSVMKPITEYGNACYLTLDSNPNASTESYVTRYYLDVFGAYESGVIFCADTDYDYDFVYSEGELYDILGKSFARTITDNVYYLDYYPGATKAFGLILDVIEGRKIAQPMKYICNTFLGLLIALFVNFLIVDKKSKLKGMNPTEMISGSVKNLKINNIGAQFTNQTRTYSPQSSGSSGGGGGHHGGGGGHHGGGGGHSH